MSKQTAITAFEKHYGLDDLIARDVLQPLEADDITIARVQEKAGVGYKGAQNLINKWVEAGEVEYIGKRRNHSQPVDTWKIKTKQPALS